ncbi:MAG: hypothetical protein CMF12_05525 [Idiomarina sp.]|uniref:porin family protein n=1 Tax=Idiomarina sp. TaxID=1874361 RepID=UPI000C456015|nr:porin family protein [Idiomarina sp.]MBT41965.1 hypothetical protein [Idiomarina sp.]
MQGIFKKLSLVTLSALASTSALAQQPMQWNDYYIAVQGSQFSADSGAADIPTAKPNVLSFAVGQTIHPNVAVEARLGFGVANDTISYEVMPGTSINSEVELDYAVSLLAKPQAQLTNQLSVYALAGWSRSEISSGGTSGAESGLSVGAGFEVKTSQQLGFYLDWLRLMDEDYFELSSINLGMTYRF